LVYFAVIGVFLWLQFSSGEAFSQKVLGLGIRGMRDAAVAEGGAVKRITLSFHGVEFRFSRFRPVLLGDSRKRLRPVAFAASADGASVEFRGLGGRRLTLAFHVEPGDQGALEVAASTEEPVALPLESPGGRIEVSQSVPALGIVRGEERLIAVLPQRSRVRWTGGYLYLSGPANQLRLARSSDGSLLMQWLLAQGSLVSDEAYRREVTDFRDRAYHGWTRSRYLPELGLWRGDDGQPAYDDRLGSAFLVEAMGRGEYERALALVLRAEDAWMRLRPTASLTHETSPFTGDVDSFAAWLVEREGPEAREAERLLLAGNPAVWRTPGIVRLLQSAGAGSVLAQAGERSLAGWDPQATDVATALGVLEASLDIAPERPPESAQIPAWLTAAAERALARVFGSLRIDGDTIGIVASDAVDVSLSLRAGALLARAGGVRQNQTLAGLGRTLIAAALRTADQEGFLPSGRRAAAPAGRMTPEEIFHVAELSPYLPALRPIGAVFGPGAWLWSAAPLRSATVNGSEVTLTFTFAPGVPHHVLIRGLPPFAQMRLKGVPWRPDPAYARYFAGWFYDADRRSLALKLTQDQAEEQVVITR